MQLTKLQRLHLQKYKRFHEEPPTQRGLSYQLLLTMIPGMMIAAAAVACFAVLESPPAATCMIGMVGGVYGTAIMVNRITVKIWPIFDAIVDWNKVDELLESDDAIPK